ncbi:MAG: hypothetical protein ACFFB5_16770 [Promethearchaeota archaeon]
MVICKYCQAKEAIARHSSVFFDYCSLNCWIRGNAWFNILAGVVIIFIDLIALISNIGLLAVMFSYFAVGAPILIIIGIIGLILKAVKPMHLNSDQISNQITELRNSLEQDIQRLDFTDLESKQLVERFNNQKSQFIEKKIPPQFYLKWLRDFKKTIGTKLQEF